MLLDGTLDGKGLVGREFGRLWMRLGMGVIIREEKSSSIRIL